LLFLLMVSTAWAQATIPGTFNTQAGQATAVVAGPILTPPIISFGSGLSAPTVINGQTAIVTGVPQGPAGTISTPGYVTGMNGFVPMPTTPVIPVAYAGAVPTQPAPPTQTARFDFIISIRPVNSSGSEAADGAVGDRSLGQLAASMRKGPPPTQHQYTNDDIARINSSNNKMPGGSTEQPPYPQQQPQTNPQPHSSIGSAPDSPTKPSPFSPRPVPQTPTSSTTAASDPN
jgi:hypothetical protein